MCKEASSADLRSLTMFRSFLLRTFSRLLVTRFDVDMTCTVLGHCFVVVHATGISPVS